MDRDEQIGTCPVGERDSLGKREETIVLAGHIRAHAGFIVDHLRQALAYFQYGFLFLQTTVTARTRILAAAPVSSTATPFLSRETADSGIGSALFPGQPDRKADRISVTSGLKAFIKVWLLSCAMIDTI